MHYSHLLHLAPSQIRHLDEVDIGSTHAIVRTTYPKGHPYHGNIDHYKDGKCVRATFEESHPSHGIICHFEEDDTLVRLTFEESHPCHGEIHHFEDDEHVRTTFDKAHPRHGEIGHYEDDTHVRTTYEQDHDDHGETIHFKDGVHVQTTFDESHPLRGFIHHFEDGKRVRTTREEDDPPHSVIEHCIIEPYEDYDLWTHVRTTYDEGHDDHGEIHHFEDDEHVRTTFDKDHPRHGQIDHYEGDQYEGYEIVRTTFDKDHPRHGQIDHYGDDESVHTTYEEGHTSHCNIHVAANKEADGAQATDENAEDPDCGVATPTGANGAEVGVSRKRAAENTSSASGSERRRGKKSRHAAKHAAARSERIEKRAEADDGGYALKAKGQARREGVAFAVAKAGEEDRTCLADAVYALLCTLAVVATKEAVRAALPATEQKDPDQKMAKRFAIDHGVDLVHQPRLTGSPMSLLKETTGAFLVRLKLTVADGSADFHYVAFDAARALIIDNAPRVKFPEIDEEDLRDNRSAIRPFYHLFPNATDIRIASVLKGVVAA